MFLIVLPPLPSLRRITQAPVPLTLRRYPKPIPSPSPTKMGFLAAGSLRRLVRASIGLRGVRAMVHSVQVWRREVSGTCPGVSRALSSIALHREAFRCNYLIDLKANMMHVVA